jgi:hypothetical protein
MNLTSLQDTSKKGDQIKILETQEWVLKAQEQGQKLRTKWALLKEK